MKKYTLLLLLFCLACRQSEQPAIKLTVSQNEGVIKFSGMPAAVLADLGRDSIGAPDWQNLIPIYRMPADTALKDYQPVVTGTYKVKPAAIVFKPDTPFIKNQVYFARYYRHDEGISLLDMIRGHKKPGATAYTELIFKY